VPPCCSSLNADLEKKKKRRRGTRKSGFKRRGGVPKCRFVCNVFYLCRTQLLHDAGGALTLVASLPLPLQPPAISSTCVVSIGRGWPERTRRCRPSCSPWSPSSRQPYGEQRQQVRVSLCVYVSQLGFRNITVCRVLRAIRVVQS